MQWGLHSRANDLYSTKSNLFILLNLQNVGFTGPPHLSHAAPTYDIRFNLAQIRFKHPELASPLASLIPTSARRIPFAKLFVNSCGEFETRI